MRRYAVKKLITLQADEEYINMIKSYAKSNYMTLTALIKRALEEYINQH